MFQRAGTTTQNMAHGVAKCLSGFPYTVGPFAAADISIATRGGRWTKKRRWEHGSTTVCRHV